jgi:hypothetical protein
MDIKELFMYTNGNVNWYSHCRKWYGYLSINEELANDKISFFFMAE